MDRPTLLICFCYFRIYCNVCKTLSKEIPLEEDWKLARESKTIKKIELLK